ncbi:hypothetical protein IJG78_01930 [Candidatus Saccharibacteria bacterium]|nr:hypothetical protein [Candidatus Saccharibacteria bacterium]
MEGNTIMTKIQITDNSDEKKLAKSTSPSTKTAKKISISTDDKKSTATHAKNNKAKSSQTLKTTKTVKVTKVSINSDSSPKKSTKKALGKLAVKSTPEKPASKESSLEKSTTEKSTPAAKSSSEKPTRAAKSRPSFSKNAINSNTTHNLLQKSTTLSRRYVKRPDHHSPTAQASAPKSVEPKAAMPNPAEPKAAESKVIEPKVVKPEAVEPKAVETESVEPKAAKTESVEPKAAESKVIEPKVVKPEVAEPKAAKPEVKKSPIKFWQKSKPTTSLAKPASAKPAIPAPKVSKSASDKVLKSAIRNVATMEQKTDTEEMHGEFRKKRKGGRIILALTCSALTVAALFAFVHFNMPDISVKVAAMQTGIEASYPDIVPRGYSLSNVSSDKDGEIVMTFEDSESNSFTLSEENSTWDSTALLNNYVKKNYNGDYTTMREQGITIYIDSDSSTWVNGGILYKVKSRGKLLTKEQLKNLATSL